LANTVTETPQNPLGAKGIGESATVGSTPAVQNAVVDALSHLGVRHLDMPLKPDRVVAAVLAAAAGALPDPWREPPEAFTGLPVRGAPSGEEASNI
jgi:aerobic carbon-monoxide dehydrogenase large subunit